jgi:hypothetical protein
MGWFRRLFSDNQSSTSVGEAQQQKKRTSMSPCGHASIEAGVRAGCMYCALNLQRRLDAISHPEFKGDQPAVAVDCKSCGVRWFTGVTYESSLSCPRCGAPRWSRVAIFSTA